MLHDYSGIFFITKMIDHIDLAYNKIYVLLVVPTGHIFCIFSLLIKFQRNMLLGIIESIIYRNCKHLYIFEMMVV